MRFFPLPLALAGLLGSTGLAPAAALAYPNDGPRYSYGGDGPPPSLPDAPLPANPYNDNNMYGSHNNSYGNRSSNYGAKNDSYGGRNSGYGNRNNSYNNGYGNNNHNSNYGNNAGRYSSAYGYPIASEPAPYGSAPVRSCNRGTVLTGAAIGGGLGAILATNSRNRLWSLPIGAAMGGILGGVMSGC